MGRYGIDLKCPKRYAKKLCKCMSLDYSIENKYYKRPLYKESKGSLNTLIIEQEARI